MPTLLSLVALENVIMTTSAATSDDKLDILTATGFQCLQNMSKYYQLVTILHHVYHPWVYIMAHVPVQNFHE